MDCVENLLRCDAHFSSFWKRCRFGIKNLAQDFRDKNPKWDLIGWSTWAFEWSASQFLQHACNWRQIKNFWFKSWNTKLETYDQEEWSVYALCSIADFVFGESWVFLQNPGQRLTQSCVWLLKLLQIFILPKLMIK